MPDAWDQIANDPEFQKLPEQQRDVVRLGFFNHQVAPNVPPEHLGDVRHSFFQDTAPAPAPQSIPQQTGAAISGGIAGHPIVAQALAGARDSAANSAGSSKDIAGAPSGIAQHLARFGGNVAGILAPGALAERGAALGVSAGVSAAEAMAPEAVAALRTAGEGVMSKLPTAVKAVADRVIPGAAARGLGFGALGAVQAEGENNGQATAKQIMTSATENASAGVLVPPAIESIGQTLGASGNRLGAAIRSRFPTIFDAAEQAKAGIPEPVEPEIPKTPSFQKAEYKNGVLMSEAKLGAARTAAEGAVNPNESETNGALRVARNSARTALGAAQNDLADLTSNPNIPQDPGAIRRAQSAVNRAQSAYQAAEESFQGQRGTAPLPGQIPAGHLADVSRAESDLAGAQKALHDRLRGESPAEVPPPPNAQPGPLSSRATQGPELGPAQVAARPALQGGPQAYGNITPEQLAVKPETVGAAPVDQTRGEIPWSKTLQDAAGPGKTAEQYLQDPAGTAYNDADITRLGQMAKAQQVQMLNAAVPETLSDPVAQAKFESEKLLHDALIAKSKGAGAEAGRALNARKILLAATETGDPSLIDKAMKMTGGEPLTLDQMIALNKAKASGDPKQIYQAISDLNPPDWADKLHAMTRNSLLSSPKSMQTVGLSSMTQNVLRLANIPVRAAIDKGMSAMTGAERTTFMGQFLPAAKAAWEAIPDAASNAYTKLTTGVSESDLSGLEMGRRPVLPGVLDAPERLIGALHQFAYTVAHNSELASQAAKMAIKDGASDVEAGMQKYLKAPSKEMLAAADRAGQGATFTSKLGTMGSKMSDLFNTSLKEANPNLPNLRPLKFLNPFMNVGTNILKEATKYSGVGLASGAAKGGEAGMADMAKGAIGVPVAAYFASKLTAGEAWGSGPPTTNKAERDRFMREHGGTTNAVVIGGKIVPFDRMGEPINVMLKTMANWHDASVYNDQHPSDKNAERLVFAFGKSIVDNSYTANIANALNAMQDPAKGQAFVQQMGQQFIPYSGLDRYVTQNMDTTVRDTRGKTLGEAVGNTVKSITPGMSQDLPARRDQLGNTIERRQNLSPFKILPNEMDPYTQQLKDLDVTPPSAPSRLGNRPLSPALQSQLLEERGQQFKTVLDRYQGQGVTPYTKVAVSEALRHAAAQVDGKYKAMAELDAHGLPPTPENAQRIGFAVAMPWFKKMSETEKANYLRQYTQ